MPAEIFASSHYASGLMHFEDASRGLSCGSRPKVNEADTKQPVRFKKRVPTVFIIGRHPAFRQSIEDAACVLGWRLVDCRDANEFFELPVCFSASCVVLDLATAQLDTATFQERIAIDRPGIPILLVAGYENNVTSVQCRPVGTANLASNSLSAERLIQSIAGSLERSLRMVESWIHAMDLRLRHESLTPREREVMALVVVGRLNKQIGGELGISEITVKAHRGNIMRKMRASCLPGLVTIAARLGLPVPDGRI